MADEEPTVEERRRAHARADLIRAFERLAGAVIPQLPEGARPIGERPVDMFHNPRYAVLRGAPGCPLPPYYEGLWLELSEMPTWAPPRPDAVSATGRATGRYEKRDDGCWAEVYEVAW